jgi:hypothetical protein
VISVKLFSQPLVMSAADPLAQAADRQQCRVLLRSRMTDECSPTVRLSQMPPSIDHITPQILTLTGDRVTPIAPHLGLIGCVAKSTSLENIIHDFF